MLPRAQRLSTVEFARVFEKSRVLRHPLLQLRIYRREQDENADIVRAAFVVPKKIGKATQRNRLRRQVRERFRLLQQGGSTQDLSNCDLIWMIGNAAETVSREEIDGALRELLERAKKFLGKSGGANSG